MSVVRDRLTSLPPLIHAIFCDWVVPAQQSSFRLVPALGEQFSHGIANRIFLHYDDRVTVTVAGDSSSNIERRATLLKSPSMPSKTVSFSVNHRGVRDYLSGSTSQPSDRSYVSYYHMMDDITSPNTNIPHFSPIASI